MGALKVECKELQNTPIYYYLSGNPDGECIIMVHPAFADHSAFDLQLAYFSKEYQVITLDLIGHGKSTNTKKGDGIDKTAEYVNQIMIAENISNAHFVGISIGGVLIQDFANKYPEKVASLCCIGTYDINNFDPSIQKENSKKQILMMLKALVSVKWFSKANKKISAATEPAQEAFYRMNVRFKKSSFRYLTTLSKLVNQFKTAERNYPLLIGCGQEDNPLAIKAAKMWSESEPNSSLVIFEYAGHLVNMDVPEKFNQVLDAQIHNKVCTYAQ
jgi:pimeloyl-ACP methyl ester carboxylesterase